MTIELTDHEAKELIITLRHSFDASMEHLPASLSASHVYVSVISKLQIGLGMDEISPWEKPESFNNAKQD